MLDINTAIACEAGHIPESAVPIQKLAERKWSFTQHHAYRMVLSSPALIIVLSDTTIIAFMSAVWPESTRGAAGVRIERKNYKWLEMNGESFPILRDVGFERSKMRMFLSMHAVTNPCSS